MTQCSLQTIRQQRWPLADGLILVPSEPSSDVLAGAKGVWDSSPLSISARDKVVVIDAVFL